ncbi:MAG: hypothetical protein BWY70_01046 [Bacteroidetes bacterium ADurb.Bin408]|nr:MAG: hypothetical protein BWY70_01046 [Bacteroidetes bacterium ADurb.Bin408]
MNTARSFFSAAEQKRITQAIKEAEKLTSGEIRVHIEGTFKGDIFDRAVYVFEKLNMHKTKDRNGVLIYLAIKSRQFVIIGDAGINSKVGQNFWDDVKEKMMAHFKNGQFTEGLCLAINKIGEKLMAFFPYNEADVNELSDEISFNN